MNKALIKTNWQDKIESKAEGRWLIDYRKYHHEMFQQYGMPDQKNEYWKYTDLSILKNKRFSYVDCKTIQQKNIHKNEQLIALVNQHRIKNKEVALLVMVDGCFVPQLSELDEVVFGLLICSLKDALHHYDELVKKYWPDVLSVIKNPFACINAALFNDGIFIHVFEKCEVKQPIHVLNIATCQKDDAIHPRNLIILGKDSHIKIYEECICLPLGKCKAFMINSVTTCYLEENANLSYIKVQHDNPDIIHLSYTEINQQQNSEIKTTNFLFGSQFAREDLVANLLAPYAKSNISGFYRTGNKTHYLDNHVFVNHLAPYTESQLLFKGILNHPARAVFNGGIFVQELAHKINAFQANHNLLLSSGAEIYSKPELEIYADDVKCKHGATVGQFDELALFYLRSRNIPLDVAQNMLVQGFAQEVIKNIDNATLKLRIEQMV